MHTKDRLAAALREIKLDGLAKRAEKGQFDDFLSPHSMPIHLLAYELAQVATPEALALRRRVVNGDFDATPEESEAWANSPEGRAAIGKLTRGE
jgi:hypothetical protein